MASRLTEAQKTLKTLAAGAKKREEFFWLLWRKPLLVGGHRLPFAFSSLPGLTRPSTRTLNHAIKPMIMLPKLETAHKWRLRGVDGQDKPGHDAWVHVFLNHSDRL